MVSALQLAAEALPLPEDRLLTFVEGAQVGPRMRGLACSWLCTPAEGARVGAPAKGRCARWE